MNRRQLLQTTALAALASSAYGAAQRPPRILLRSSWQIVNIGDIAHTPGVLALLEKHIPEAEVRLWASADLSDEVAAMEKQRFPKLQVVKGSLDADGKASNPQLADAVAWADFLLHGSGPSLVAAADVGRWRKAIGKPYGVYGITLETVTPETKATLDGARFVYLRDSVSLSVARREKIESPIVEFSPDGAFACDVRDDAAATAFLREHGLEEGKFLCCIPRYRMTPRWLFSNKKAPFEQSRQDLNDAKKEQDHAPLREAIAAVVRQTGLKVLICPEDETQIGLGRQMLLDKLPEDVRGSVVWRDRFWLTDEALSTYVRSAGLFGNEMHSPIMCIGQGIPAIVCRWKEQTSKGFMWRDIGLGDWLFDMDKPEEVARIVPAVLAMAQQPAKAREKAAQARATVQQRLRETMQVVRSSLS